MKTRVIIAITLLSVAYCNAWSQAVQVGIVKEYNERLEKTPLNQVEITISNAASTVSDKNGNFTLQFRTLKPGDKVNVRRIEKLGYEIFNKEALEQWYVARSNTPFVIVMCKSEKFKRIRDNYSQVSSDSYEKQLKKEEARLAAERKAGKLKEAEYEAALKKLNDEYDRQLEDLDNYIDQFARIDLSELSQTEARIIELVQQGKIEEAIHLYEGQGLEEKYKRQVMVSRKVQVAIDTLATIKEQSAIARDSLFACIKRKNETLRLAGGRENFEKIGQSLKDIALADTTNQEAVWEYAQFAQRQAIFNDAIEYYSIYIRACTDLQPKTLAMVKLADTYRALKKYDKCESYCTQALVLARQLYSGNPDAFAELLGTALACKGTMYYEINQLTDSEQLFLEAESQYIKLSEDGSEVHLYTLSKMQNNLGNLYRRMRQFEKSEMYLKESLKNTEMLSAKDHKKYLFDLASTRNNLGLTYKLFNRFDSCEVCYKQAIEEMEQLFQFNPKAYREEYFKYLSNIGVLYKSMKRYDDSEHYNLLALAHADTLYAINKEAYAVYLGNTLLNMGNLYNKMDRSEDSKRFLLKALPILDGLYKKNPRAFCVNLFSCNMSLGNACMYLNQYEEAEPYFRHAEQLGEELAAINPEAYGFEHYLILKNLAITYSYLDQTEEAEQYYKPALRKIEALYLENPEAYEREIISCSYSYGDFCKGNGRMEQAAELFNQVLKLCQHDPLGYQNYIQKIQKAFSEMGSENH